MAKTRRLRSSILEGDNEALRSNLDAAEEVVARAVNADNLTLTDPKRKERIKFTTVISPHHRACLEFLAKQQKISMADLLDGIIGNYVKNNQLIEDNKDLLAAFEIIYKAK